MTFGDSFIEQGAAAHDLRLPANRARVLCDLEAGV